MTDITHGDKPKLLVRMLLWYFKKHYNINHKVNIQFDIENCGNPVIRNIREKVHEGTSHMNNAYHRDSVNEVVDFLLWIIYKDTAYRQPFFYIFNNILDDVDVLKPMVKRYCDEPDGWYINAWIKSMQNTKDKQKNKKLRSIDKSYDEQLFVPELQHKKYDELYKEKCRQMERELEIEKKRKGWL